MGLNNKKSRRSFIKGIAAAMMVISTLKGGAVFAATVESPAPAKKTLIVYYSRSGNTRAMAQIIHSRVGGDIIELQTVHPYPTEHRPTSEQAQRELDTGYQPPLTTKVENMDSYDLIIIGAPSWRGTHAVPIRTFLSEYDFSGKTILPFITHNGSGLGNSMNDLRKFCPNSTILEGLAVSGSRAASSHKTVDDWLKETKIVR